MDIVEFTKKINKLEVSHNFFDVKDENGLAYWDIARHDVFYAIYYELSGIKLINSGFSNSKLSRINSIFKYFYHSFKLKQAISNKTYKYICFTFSRYRNEKNENIDYAMDDIVSNIDANEVLLLENNIIFGETFAYTSYLNTGVITAGYFNKFKQLFSRPKDRSFLITQILKQEFGVKANLNQIINGLIKKYTLEVNYYLKLFKTVKPDQIFLVQSGLQKGLFKAANALQIPSYEMQHGLVSFIHPAYDYPPAIDLKNSGNFPAYFLSFSPFWSNNIHYPVQETITLGNTFFSKKPAPQPEEFDLLVVFADIYTQDLLELLNKFLSIEFTGKIAVKLHPNQKREVDFITKYFVLYPNVTVICDERTIKELLLASNSVLAVQSTCVYEALYDQVKVLIYKVKDYHTHEDIFNNPNVYQIDNCEEIRDILKRTYILDDQIKFFNPFDRKLFLDLLKHHV
ncbi:hypothetical protein [Pedobacter boryungensis]|uniref:Capsule polysaccharide biosynthesis protein n=1 Tax=Pedobacter boryungensis TaxID=869962 RepID=A0ABX2DFQ4_9SPHI|nr:hypothetical protein [Pedobacter boryungensis]NQX32760.1 hypothetical protein [Pedobacter boryungensis]